MSGFRIKQEPIDIAAMDDEETTAAAAATVKREPGGGGGGAGGSVKLEPGTSRASAAAAMAAAASVGPPPPPPPKQRPSFALSAPSGSAAAASSSSSAAGASSAAAPAVMTSSTLRARLQRRPRSILDYLCSLDRGVLDTLYRDPFTCLTIFRSLHPLAKQYLLRWLFVTEPLRLSLIDSWVLATPTSRMAHKQAMDTLFELQLLLKTNDALAAPPAAEAGAGKTELKASKAEADPDPLVWFNPAFQRCLQDALCNKVDATGGVASADGSDSAAAAAAAADPDRPSLGELEAYAADKWDAILHFMVGAARVGASTGPPSREVVARLVSMGLMESPAAAAGASAAASKPHITPSGFAFLFKDMATQVWDVILAYMESLAPAADAAPAAGAQVNAHADRDQVLQFLFRLSFLKLGSGYPTAGLSPTQKRLLADLTAFGLVYMKHPHAAMYYPTRLALNLSSTSGSAAQGTAAAAAAASSAVAGGSGSSSIESSRTATATSSSSSEGYIILETTFRLYAFTTSPFHAALLGLFTRLDIRLPNLLVGTITKESVRAALKAHISSGEIIAYLEAYARADMRVNTPLLPENVTDQIRLWEAERNRMALQESFLFEFDANDTPQVVALVTQEAFRHAHTLLLHHPAKKLLVVTPDGYAILKAFKLRLNQQIAAGMPLAKQV